MKKGFTLTEMIIVFAIISIIAAVTTLNFVRLGKSSRVDSYADEIAAMLKETYENSSKEMDYESWHVEIKKIGDKFYVELKGNNAQKEVELVDTDIVLKNDSSTMTLQNVVAIMFSSNGNIIVKYNDGTKLENENLYVEICDRNNPSIKKVIEINSLPPGNIMVK
ncbi:prepilin-type N-terminal cleavage/methylation domain-containing protein [Caloramator sp. CAR-1]|uniref:prepilin-type N-terminal cleavage/methylation domain-containing protein n=1 Tax=Caloramator sp. CAR-1 TaxID=3062777 RepID=UPI0026E1DE08|nr:prepilin-type N-terminal cleavage/methylation domain-containing protein [Caloramator sp. CAR-1]MDO6354207.1 prepilin-type N-terminal cleavage/methylation domain-containing protein [Caloramator sp. CAR-1]